MTAATPTLGEVYWRGAMTDPDDAGAWPTLAPNHRADIERGAQAVAGAAIQRRIDSLGPVAFPESRPAEQQEPKIIIVERNGHPGRLFAATEWVVLSEGAEAGDLVLTGGSGENVAQLGARLWDSVCDAEAILPGDLYARHGKKLAIALDALRYVATSENADGERAAQALNEIAELDL